MRESLPFDKWDERKLTLLLAREGKTDPLIGLGRKAVHMKGKTDDMTGW